MSADASNALADDIARRLKDEFENSPGLATRVFGQEIREIELNDEVVAPGLNVRLEDGARVAIEPDVQSS